MEAPWKKPFKDREEARAALGPMGLMAHICNWLGIVFVILGVIAGAMNATLGLEPLYWFLLAIVVFMASIPFYMGLGLAWYLRTTGAKGEKKE